MTLNLPIAKPTALLETLSASRGAMGREFLELSWRIEPLNHGKHAIA
jgi:hypothetical protein